MKPPDLPDAAHATLVALDQRRRDAAPGEEVGDRGADRSGAAYHDVHSSTGQLSFVCAPHGSRAKMRLTIGSKCSMGRVS